MANRDWNVSEQATALLDDALVIDMTLPWMEFSEERDLSVLKRYKKSGFNYVSLTLGMDDNWRDDTVRYIGEQTAWVKANEQDLVLALSVDDIEQAKRDDKLAIGFHLQGTNPFQGDLGMVQTYYQLGIRHALIAYNARNLVGDGCHERTDAGLSRFGLKWIEEMNRVGMIVDCTHTGHKSTLEAIEASAAPCIFSHSLCKQLFDHDRNIQEDQIKAIGRTRGVIGVNGLGRFLNEEADASAEAVFKHIDHIAQTIGPEHVGLGLDFVYFVGSMKRYQAAKSFRYPSSGYHDESKRRYFEPEGLPKLTELMLDRGYSEDVVRGILGGNFARICREVWK